MLDFVRKIKILLFLIVISIFITLFGISEIKAYYQKELNVNIPFTTASYSDLTLSLDKTSYPSGNNTSTVLLTVTNPNSYAVSYTLSFSNTNATYTIDGSAGGTYVVTENSNKTNTIAINGATGTSITITVNTVLPYSASKTIVASFDNVNPTVEVTTTNNVAASQTATLKCSDTVGVTAYYWGTTEPTSVSNITTTTTADLNSLKSTSGLAKTVSGAGTYWLGCRDAAGNFSKTSIVYRKVTLSMSNGTVSPTSIVAKNGNSVALPTPTANNGYTNAGYWYSSNAYSTSVGAYGANYTVSSTTTIYSRATDVTAPTVSFNPNTSSSYAKTASVTVTVADAGSKVKAGQSIKYLWQTGTTCSTTASDYSNTVALSNTSAAAETATATVPASGLTGTYYLCIYKDIQDVDGNNSVITKSGSFLFDNTAPSSCSWGNWSTSYIKSGGTATITLTCADANSGIAMDLATSDVTVSGTNLGSVTAVSKGGSNASRTYTFTLTGGSASGTPTLTIAANKIQDVAGNKFATAKTSGSIIVDVAAPTLAVGVSNGTTYAKSKTATVTISDTGGSGLAATAQTIRYVWSTSNVTTCNSTSMPNTISITPTAGASSATGTITIDSGTGAGKLYICNSAAISDRVSNSLAASTIKSADMYLDNTAPSSCSWGSWSSSYIKSGETATITLTCADANSGITMDLATSDVTVSGTNLGSVTAVSKGGSNASRTYTFTLTGGSASGTPTLTIAANKIQDVAGNKFATAKTSDSIIVDVAAPTLAVSVSNGTTYAKSKSATVTIADTGGSGLTNTAQTIRYVWSTSNVTTCNSTSMPNTISITPTAGASSATGTITIDSGTGAGKLYICNSSAISDRASNSLAASTIKSADMYLDNTAPSSCNWGNWSTSYIKSGGTATITLTCADANSGITMDLATSDVTVSGTNLGTVTAVSKGGSNASRTYTFTLTGGSASGNATLTIAANKIQDVAGNKFATAKTSGSIIVDVAAPTCTWGGWVSSSIGYGTTTTNTITCTDTGSGIPSTYASLTSNAFSVSDASISILSVTSTSVTNGYAYTVTVSGAAAGSGTISLKANQVLDNNNNANVAIASGSLTITKINSVAPTLTGWSGTYDGNSHTVTVSGGAGGTIKYSTDGTNWSTTKPSAVGSNTANTVVTVYAYVQGDANHNDSEIVSATITINVPARTYTMYFNKNTATSITKASNTSCTGSTTLTCTCTIAAGDATPGCTITTPTITRANYTICGWGDNTHPTRIVGAASTITLSADNNGSTMYAITGLKATNFAGALTVTSGSGLYDTSSFSTGEGTKYMYRGGSPNNYIYFNCTNELAPSSSTCETWRILSIEQTSTTNTTKVIEIVNTNSTTSSTWNNSSTTTYWSGSYAQSNTATIYNNLKSGPKSHVVQASYYNKTLNTTNYGKGSSQTLANTTAYEIQTENQYYYGIPRVTDYLIASTYTSANTKWSNMTGTNLSSNNWMRNTNYDYWFISKNTSAYGRHQAKSNGDVLGNKNSTSDTAVLLPVLHLNNNVFLIGSGTTSDPYYICPACMTSNTCTVTTSSGWATSKTLTINPSNSAVTYSFNGTSFSSNNQMSVSAANTYTGYIKDNGTGLVSSCYIVIKAKQQWQHDTCSSCKTCWHCTSGVYCNTVAALPSSSCFAGLDNSYANDMAGCETAGSSYGWNFCNNACYSNVFNASNAANCKTCGCNSWNTTDTTWYDSSCGDSTYSNCKNRTSAGRMVYGTG